MDNAPAVLIAADSGRALAQSARRAGYAPLVVDFFGDDDTRAAAEACIALQDGRMRGFRSDALLHAIERLSADRQVAGFVYGPGFEDRVDILADVAAKWRLFGNAPAVVGRLKDPMAFASLCRQSAIPHPEASLTRPQDSRHWLARQRGGSGGKHIRPAAEAQDIDELTYFQRFVPGRPVSALTISDGRDAELLGFSDQWAAPGEGRPFRYSGAKSPAQLAPNEADALSAAVRRFHRAMPLLGLNSFDFLVAGDEFWLLEVNPRPGATLDIFETEASSAQSLFALHVDACAGWLRAPPPFSDARAAAIVYLDREIAEMPGVAWPEWVRDRQRVGTTIDAVDPFCTVVSRADTVDDAMRDLTERAAFIRSLIENTAP